MRWRGHVVMIRRPGSCCRHFENQSGGTEELRGNFDEIDATSQLLSLQSPLFARVIRCESLRASAERIENEIEIRFSRMTSLAVLLDALMLLTILTPDPTLHPLLHRLQHLQHLRSRTTRLLGNAPYPFPSSQHSSTRP